MFDRGELPVTVRAERQLLNRIGSMADGGEHLSARQHELHRPPRDARGKGREYHMRPGAQPCAERTTHERHQHAHAGRIDAERSRQRVAHAMRALRRVMDGEHIAVPRRDRGEQTDRIVRVLGCGVGGLDLHVSCREGPSHVSTPVAPMTIRGRAVWAAVGSVQDITAATPRDSQSRIREMSHDSSGPSLLRSYCGRTEYVLPPSAFEMSAIARCARMLLPASSSGGETTAMPNLPGDTAMMPPPTPLLAGSPV
jgi:hypothetical protein